MKFGVDISDLNVLKRRFCTEHVYTDQYENVVNEINKILEAAIQQINGKWEYRYPYSIQVGE